MLAADPMALFDPHSFADDDQPFTKEIDLSLSIDFQSRSLEGAIELTLDRPAGGVLDLDTRALRIESVESDAEGRVPFELDRVDPIRGTRLRAHLSGERVRIRFRASADASALQWLEPEQTAGKRQPYVYTQCQPIHARSLFPCQDSARVRTRYRTRIDLPRAARAVMAANHLGRTEVGHGRALESFEMTQPIPPYLFAFAAGDIMASELGPRSRVYAEPEVLASAASEFAGVDAMIRTAESLFGPYDWDRFDLLVMPPSFPYGGMENPRLTFITPTVIAGDRSLVNVVAHELAHSWTGNLVTSATMNDFWLNEGFTTYAERRILEALEGPEKVAFEAALGFDGLQTEIARFGSTSPFTRLRNQLEGVDPDSVYSRVPYEKGYLFLARLEQVVGRGSFDRFLKRYIERFRFKSISTDDFLGFLVGELVGIDEKVDLTTWIDGTGIPADAPRPRSAKLEAVEALALAYARGGELTTSNTSHLTPAEWLLLLSKIPQTLPKDRCAALDHAFHFSESRNAELRVAWLTVAAKSGHEPAIDVIRRDLREIGRMKYLRPLYGALATSGPAAHAVAEEIYRDACSGYHPVARSMVEGILRANPA